MRKTICTIRFHCQYAYNGSPDLHFLSTLLQSFIPFMFKLTNRPCVLCMRASARVCVCASVGVILSILQHKHVHRHKMLGMHKDVKTLKNFRLILFIFFTSRVALFFFSNKTSTHFLPAPIWSWRYPGKLLLVQFSVLNFVN